MKIPFVDLKAQYLSIKSEIDKAIADVIDDVAFIGGKYVKKFEQEFAKALDVNHCISVANGTDAIYIALKMLGIGAGDEVITTAVSWIATSETITLTGAKPVFVDIDKYFTIDADQIEKKITKNTKAIIPVHLYGQACNMKKIADLCKKYNLYLIEDCAQAHFTKYDHVYTGKFGIASTFSFFPGKNLGAYGDAGCIVTNDTALADKCRMYANHGALQKHNHLIEGINSRLDGLQAAILSVKLPHIFDWTNKRKNNAHLYNLKLNSISEITLPAERENTSHSYHLYVIKAEHRDKLMLHLKEQGIDTAIHYPVSLPFMPAYGYLKLKPDQFPNAYNIQSNILSLPMYPELTEDQIDFVADQIKGFYNKPLY